MLMAASLFQFVHGTMLHSICGDLMNVDRSTCNHGKQKECHRKPGRLE
ncbi:hypothetical protein Desti_0986 [Desulfomonile tiedjei DSM 6799]|uniref:Uncharacterized protein n=1 Tax=Desulfomonile tiedjei (strain ATCC 49306 / DSM 6799 / DCB-1) TaxID=706587 RepID=I4C2B3_DESTA|nr:hypothetical protein Desti_0986 [Desulfomonile tiedjei DSM 6799]